MTRLTKSPAKVGLAPADPDLNIMGSVWGHMKRWKTRRQTRSTEEIRQVHRDTWKNLPAKYFDKLCVSVLRRTGAVLKAKGGHSKH